MKEEADIVFMAVEDVCFFFMPLQDGRSWDGFILSRNELAETELGFGLYSCPLTKRNKEWALLTFWLLTPRPLSNFYFCFVFPVKQQGITIYQMVPTSNSRILSSPSYIRTTWLSVVATATEMRHLSREGGGEGATLNELLVEASSECRRADHLECIRRRRFAFRIAQILEDLQKSGQNLGLTESSSRPTRGEEGISNEHQCSADRYVYIHI